MQEIPTSFYYLVGAVIVTNLGAVLSMIIVGFRSAWWLSKLDSRVEHTHELATRAHKRLDELKLQLKVSAK